ncbi:MAG: MerR family transcriptional regulator [Bacteroidota bacterium]
MRIGEVSRLTGFTPDTLRWYEKIGLISLEENGRTTGNYRTYSEEVLARLFLIKSVKNLGFSLKEIQLLLDLEEEQNLTCESISGVFNQKIEQVKNKIQALQELQVKLSDLVHTCPGNCKEHIQKGTIK